MRLSKILMTLIASFLVANESFSFATSGQGFTPIEPCQRSLRARQSTTKDSEDSEARTLDNKTMMEMMTKLITKEEHAADLGILDDIMKLTTTNGGGLTQFMKTVAYKKHIAYVDFLNTMKRKKEYAELVAKIKEKSKKMQGILAE
ncbi:hypothetical protein F441_12901 [Phytophthora nicotianae CJ01A1]|uniref:PexRD2 WYL domain-containing protein n=8 Tax=Phytophthora nicotianae TaxID=4792 RepID=W2R5W4_PHYN3|nr:hypothetical protein PPTG_03025 [Phytophthora nicotianae INRA-310]ETI41855.1 hypothetical protein F443_12935 [Phytophthora nicotianae P1569]ETO70483.1 hypothetical protein F444_13039 [Phytophthora nicotianae P1976]ETP11613.1 hypothetical protein F441_12901 [Phytophthora nicotianae CJ01A1]KUF81878.1 hypothetical protein AM588_10000308 [Phytophthora nicotianae]ETN19900.1 hypothetical protein PPTG_03025 [Phytophthora nicotianae INRA-310]